MVSFIHVALDVKPMCTKDMPFICKRNCEHHTLNPSIQPEMIYQLLLKEIAEKIKDTIFP